MSVIFIYVVLRSIYNPIFYDEVLNFQLYAQTGAFQPFHSYPDANNHLISTTLNHLIYLLVGKDLILFRIPETLSFILMAYYIFRSRIFFQSKVAFAGLVLLIFGSVYIISFFSMARGYGLSFAFIIAALFHFFRYFKTPNYRDLIALALFCSLCIWSNLALIFTVTAILGLTQLKIVLPKSKISTSVRWVSSGVLTVLGMVPLFVAILFSFELRNAEALYIGYNSDPLFVYLIALPADMFMSDAWGLKLSILWVILTIGGVILYLLRYKLSINLILMSLIFVATVGGTIVANLFMEVNYPEGRAAVHVFILFAFVFCLLFDQLQGKLKYLVLIPGLYFTTHLIVTASLNYAIIWQYECITEEFSHKIKNLQEESDHLLTISSPGGFAKTMGYYNWKNDAQTNFYQDMGYPNTTADLILTQQWVRDIDVDFSGYDTIYYEADIDVALLKRKKLLTWHPLHDTLIESKSSSGSVIDLAELTFDTEANRAYKVEISTDLRTNKIPGLSTVLVFAVESENESCGRYNFGLIANSFPDDIKPFHYHRSLYASGLGCEQVTFRLYLLSVYGASWKFDQTNITFYESEIID